MPHSEGRFAFTRPEAVRQFYVRLGREVMAERGQSLRDRTKEATRARLVAAARRAFAEEGYEDVSLARVCRLAQTNRVALAHHFPGGKEELLEAVADEALAELEDRISAADSSADGWTGVRAACNAYLDAWADPALRTLLFRTGPRAIDAEFISLHQRSKEPFVTRLVREWIERGLLRPRPVVILSRLFEAMFEEAGTQIVSASDREHTRAELNRLLAEWLEGLRRKPGELPNVLATDRVVLEPWALGDIPELAELCVESGLGQVLFASQARHSEPLRRLVFESERRFAQGELGMFVARDGSGRPVGVVGLVPPRPGEAEELVVAVDRSFQGRGYGQEIAEAALREGRVRGCKQVRATTDETNAPFVHLLENLGFVRAEPSGSAFLYVRAQ